jgi:pyruvate formate lyase activating enzyme
MKPARYWRAISDTLLECELCPHRCRLRDGRVGRCRARGAEEGRLYSLSYGRISSSHVDPIEKKPLYHFHPGSSVFSIGSWGCNLCCVFCQNWSISQQGPVREGGVIVAPQEVVQTALREGCPGIAYTYNEPIVTIEYVIECARLARDNGLWNVLVTNGYINPEPAAELLALMDALNVDIKSMEDEFYRRYCGGTLAPVLDFCIQARRAGCHLEITNLVITNLNDQPNQAEDLALWIKEHLGLTTPLHLSAYRPEYRLQEPSTPRAVLDRAWEAARRHLPYVYQGNVLSDRGSHTLCPECGKELIRRWGYDVKRVGLIEPGQCAHCGRPADIVL